MFVFRGAWVAQSVSNLDSGHDLAVRDFEPHLGLYADSSEPGAYLGLCVTLSLSLSLLLPAHTLSLSKINIKKKFF